MVLDADAQQSIADARVEEIVRIAAEQAANISYLPYTPEMGLVEYLHGNRAEALMKLRQHFVLNTLSLRAQDIPLVPDDAAKPRKVAKGIVDKVCDLLAQQLPNASSLDVEVALLKLLADHTFRNSMPRVMQQFGPILRG